MRGGERQVSRLESAGGPGGGGRARGDLFSSLLRVIARSSRLGAGRSAPAAARKAGGGEKGRPEYAFRPLQPLQDGDYL